MDRDDVRVVKLCRRSRLAKELLDLLICKLPFARNLQGHRSVEFGVASFPNGSKPAQTQARYQLEATNSLERRRVPCVFVAINQVEGASAKFTFDTFVRRVGQKL